MDVTFLVLFQWNTKEKKKTTTASVHYFHGCTSRETRGGKLHFRTFYPTSQGTLDTRFEIKINEFV